MKFLRYFILFNVIFCSSLFSMETKKQDDLHQVEFPQDIWREIISYIKNLDFKTEAEFIKTFNALRGTNKNLYNLVNEYIKSQVKPEAGKQYLYKDLMLDLIDQIITKKAGSDDIKKKAESVVEFKAINWLRSNRLKIENSPRGLDIPLSKDTIYFRELYNESFRKEINNIIKKANNEIEEQDYKLIGELLNISKIGVVVEYEGKKWDLLDVFVYKNNFKMVDLILKMTFKKEIPSKFQELLEKAIKISEMNLYKKVGFLSYYSGRFNEDN